MVARGEKSHRLLTKTISKIPPTYRDYLLIRKGKFWPGTETDAIKGRHPNKTVNVGFVDGHVSRVKAEELLTDSKGNTSEDSDVKWKPK